MSGYWHSGGRQCISWHRQTGLLSAQSRAGTGYVEWVTAFSVTWCDRQEVKPISKSVQIMPTQRTKESPHIRSPINHRSPSGNFIADNIIIGRLRFGFKEENRPRGIKMCYPPCHCRPTALLCIWGRYILYHEEMTGPDFSLFYNTDI